MGAFLDSSLSRRRLLGLWRRCCRRCDSCRLWFSGFIRRDDGSGNRRSRRHGGPCRIGPFDILNAFCGDNGHHERRDRCRRAFALAQPRPDLRLGYQPPYIGVAVMQQQKLLDDAFKGEKINLAYQRLLSPTPIYEALAGGSLDLGMGGPPIAALANGQPFQILAVIERSPKTHALLVNPDSPVKTVADLKGKKIGSALGKAYAFPIRALQQAALTDTDVQWLTIENNEGRSALLSGGLDAWATWDPFYASVEADKQVRKLVDGDPWYPNFVTLFGRTDYVNKYPDTVIRFMQTYNRALAYVRDHHADAVSIFAKENMLTSKVAELTVSRRNYQFAPPGDDFLADVTDQGKLFARLGVTKTEPDWTKAINTTLAKAALAGM